MKFFKEIKQLRIKLENLGFEVLAPEEVESNIDYANLSKEKRIDIKQKTIDRHLGKIKKSDAILLANYSKNGIDNYIGANTFLEMAFAYILEKRIFILNDIPEQPNTDEIEGLKPIVLKGDLRVLNDLIDERSKGS